MQRTATPLTSVRFRSQPPIMKILVTGSSGFIGYHVVKQLIKKGHYVYGVDNHNEYYCSKIKEDRNNLNLNKNFFFLKADINNLPKFSNTNFDLVIHLAAQAGVRVLPKFRKFYKTTNINGFKSICNFCHENNINKIIYASSSSVYSDSGKEKFSESCTKLTPKSQYGSSKLENETFATRFAKKNDISMIGLRFFSVYGPYGRPDMAYFSFTESIKNGSMITLYDNGNMLRDMTYIDDIVDGIMKSIDYISKEKINGKNEIFNLGNERPIKTIDVLNTIESLLNKKSKIKLMPSKNEALRTHANISKAKKVLGYSPQTSFNDGIKNFITWHNQYENEKRN